jgi:hypothetical protein
VDKLTIDYRDVKSFGCSEPRVTEDGWELALVGGVHRDSESIDVSNHEVIMARLEAIDPEREHWDTMEASHWAVGWYRHLIVDTSYTAVLKVLADAKESLDGYAILDEMHWSNTQVRLHADGECQGHCDFCEEENED